VKNKAIVKLGEAKCLKRKNKKKKIENNRSSKIESAPIKVKKIELK
jgi:hypothetical protein